MTRFARGLRTQAPEIVPAAATGVEPIPPANSRGGAPNTSKMPAKARAEPKTSKLGASSTLIFSAAVLMTLAAGWHMRGELYVVPGTGIGYWIGIAGSVMMLSLLLYPLRKKFAKVSNFGSMHSWFKGHMITGILGPVLVILHSNFQLKSVNATVATVVMLIVVASGITGRFLYSRVHRGLYGAKAELKGLLSEADDFRQAFGGNFEALPETIAELKACELAIQQPNQSFRDSFRQKLALSARTRASRAVLRAEVQAAVAAVALREHWDEQAYKAQLRSAWQHLDTYCATIRKAAGLKFYSRLLSWWHVLHLPLFFLLIVVTVVHILAVHLY